MPTLNLSQIRTKSELMDTLGAFFSLPDWWGQNWDAFADCIADAKLSSLPSSFDITGMEELRKHLGEDARIFQEILDENGIEYTLLPSRS